LGRGKIRVVVLGGAGEIGRNMMLVEYGDDIVVIDAGIMFPENYMLGIDVVIPDLTYVVERKDRVRAIIVTHGHEDHTGALPYLLKEVNAPLYTTLLTRGLIEVKLKEHKIRDAEIHTIGPEDELIFGPLRVEFFRVSHSIPDCVGLAIHTPIGTIVHSGDFKFDHSPVDGRRTDFSKLAKLGGEGVLLLMSDSTNAETPGYTSSESEIQENFDRIFENAEGRVIVATFASNISRVQQIAETAMHYDRRVAVVGRSMVSNSKMARELGFLDVPEGLIIPIDEASRLPHRKVTLVCTGSQGEPTSALVRMSRDEFRSVRIVPGDTVVVSATPIPGNEEMINRTLDNLFRLGANVHYDELLKVHVSGHASQEEQKLMISLIKPKFFVPIHGEYRHLVLHAQIAQQVGIEPENTIIMESGDVLELDQDRATIVDRVSQDYVFVDGRGVGDVGQVVLEDRRLLAENGFLVASVTLDKLTGDIVAGPEIISRGFVYVRESEELLERARQVVTRVVQQQGNRAVLGERIKDALTRFAYEEIGRRPVILPVVLEV
jgi:ribonuclease J